MRKVRYQLFSVRRRPHFLVLTCQMRTAFDGPMPVFLPPGKQRHGHFGRCQRIGGRQATHVDALHGRAILRCATRARLCGRIRVGSHRKRKQQCEDEFHQASVTAIAHYSITLTKWQPANTSARCCVSPCARQCAYIDMRNGWVAHGRTRQARLSCRHENPEGERRDPHPDRG